MLTLNSDSVLKLVYPRILTGTAYESLVDICKGNIILTIGGFIPGFAASFLLIDVWGRKPIQLMGFIILTILFWIMGMSIRSRVSRMTLDAFLSL